MRNDPVTRSSLPALSRLAVGVLTLGVLLAAPETEGCSTCVEVPPFVAARTELLIYDPPAPPTTVRYE